MFCFVFVGFLVFGFVGMPIPFLLSSYTTVKSNFFVFVFEMGFVSCLHSYFIEMMLLGKVIDNLQ